MTCAKRTVLAVIEDAEGRVLSWGSNVCLSPQAVCPREPGEGYEKCRSVCRQVGHAEEVALAQLTPAQNLAAAHCRVLGISHVCPSCQHALWVAGIDSFTVGQPAPL